MNLQAIQTALREAGFDGYITKPIDVRSFPDQISKVLLGKAGTEIA